MFRLIAVVFKYSEYHRIVRQDRRKMKDEIKQETVEMEG